MSLIEHWYAALHSAHGVVIESSNVDRTIQQLYQARKAAGDPALSPLSVTRSPVSPTQIWIYRREAKVPDPAGEGNN